MLKANVYSMLNTVLVTDAAGHVTQPSVTDRGLCLLTFELPVIPGPEPQPRPCAADSWPHLQRAREFFAGASPGQHLTGVHNWVATSSPAHSPPSPQPHPGYPSGGGQQPDITAATWLVLQPIASMSDIRTRHCEQLPNDHWCSCTLR